MSPVLFGLFYELSVEAELGHKDNFAKVVFRISAQNLNALHG